MRVDLSSVTAAIFVGGRGTRLRAAVPNRPKALAEIAGRPFLSYQLDRLVSAGIREAVLCTGDRAAQIRASFGATYGSLRLHYSHESTPLDTAGALRLAFPLLPSDVVLAMNGDCLCDVDLEALWEWHGRHHDDVSLALVQVAETSRYGCVRLDQTDRILGFAEKSPDQGGRWINAGVYLFSRWVIEEIPAGRPVSLEREIFPRLAQEGRLHGYRSRDRFLDIGTPESYRMAEAFIRQGKGPMGRYVVTGGAGFIGSHLCDRLLADGATVLCVDNLITGRLANVAHLEGHPGFRLIQHDISKPLEVTEPVDYVLHFASPASPVDYLRYPIQTLKVGSLGTLNALGIAKAKGAKFLLASTSEVYGDPQVHPQPERYWGHVNPVGPRGVYDEAKRFAEALTMAYHREHGLDTRIVRIFNTYGERMRLDDGRVIPMFIGQALRGEPLTVFGNGSQTRSFCFIDDLIEGLTRLMRTEVAEPVNLGNPAEYTILELAKRILEVTRSASQIVFRPLPQDDPKQRCPDLTTAHRLLEWQPTITLHQGLERTVVWFAQDAVRTSR